MSSQFHNRFHAAPDLISRSPGRINIIGEHIDYNEGFVMPAAVDKQSVFQIKKNGTPHTVNVYSINMEESHSWDLTNFKPIESGWQNYVMGVVHELQEIGAELAGFDATFEGDVPIGGGMSSSASLECALAYGLNELFDLGLDKWDLIKASQLAEHNFVGIKCGIMDQFASTMGKKDHVMLLDCRSLEFEYVPFDLGDYQLLLLNTNVSHSLASSEYNARREECEEGVSIFQQKYTGIQSLRDVSGQMFSELGPSLPELIRKRCRHVITEIHRVKDAVQALRNRDFPRLGQLIYQSHLSLSQDYEVSCTELDFLVDLTMDKDYILGSRMMGGGFGGCTLSIIEKNKAASFIELASQTYRDQFGFDLSPYSVSIESGASLMPT